MKSVKWCAEQAYTGLQELKLCEPIDVNVVAWSKLWCEYLHHGDQQMLQSSLFVKNFFDVFFIDKYFFQWVFIF